MTSFSPPSEGERLPSTLTADEMYFALDKDLDGSLTRREFVVGMIRALEMGTDPRRTITLLTGLAKEMLAETQAYVHHRAASQSAAPKAPPPVPAFAAAAYYPSPASVTASTYAPTSYAGHSSVPTVTPAAPRAPDLPDAAARLQWITALTERNAALLEQCAQRLHVPLGAARAPVHAPQAANPRLSLPMTLSARTGQSSRAEWGRP